MDSTRGKEGWFGREGQPPGLSVTITRLTQVGVVVWLGNDRKMTLMDPDGPHMCRASQFWGTLLRRKRTAAIVQYRVVQRWLIKIQNWTSLSPRGGWEPSGSSGALDKSTPTANAANRERWIDTTDDVSRKKRRREEIRRTANTDTGTSAERTGRTKDQVQRNRRNQSDGSCETPLTDSGGGGG